MRLVKRASTKHSHDITCEGRTVQTNLIPMLLLSMTLVLNFSWLMHENMKTSSQHLFHWCHETIDGFLWSLCQEASSMDQEMGVLLYHSEATVTCNCYIRAEAAYQDIPTLFAQSNPHWWCTSHLIVHTSLGGLDLSDVETKSWGRDILGQDVPPRPKIWERDGLLRCLRPPFITAYSIGRETFNWALLFASVRYLRLYVRFISAV